MLCCLFLIYPTESLTPCPPAKLCHITHWEVGKYFKHFTGTKYIPNHALLEKYPN